MELKDQLLEMLDTIEGTETFLRGRCAAGMAGQSLPLFEDLFSLIGLIEQRFAKSEYLPLRTPVFRDQIDALAAVELLDRVLEWTNGIRERVRRKEMRQQLARGGILGAAAEQGKPFADTAKALAELAKSGTSKLAEESAPTVEDKDPAESFVLEQPQPTSTGDAPVDSLATGSKRFDATQESARLARAVGAVNLPETTRAVRQQESVRADEKRTGRPMVSPLEDVAQAQLSDTQKEDPPSPRRSRPMGAPREAQLEDSVRSKENGQEEEVPSLRRSRLMGASRETEQDAPPAQPMEDERQTEATPRRRSRPMGEPHEAVREEAAPLMESEQQKELVGEKKNVVFTKTGDTLGDGRNAADRAFAQLMDKIEPLNEKQVAGRMIGAFPKLENRYKMVIIDFLRRFPYWGPLDPERDIYGAFSARATQLVQHRRDFVWLYDRLADYRSKKTLHAILDNWFSFNFKDLTNVKERVFANYFDFDLLRFQPDEVFVDLGACTGEVTQAFAQNCGGYRKIYCYEIADANIVALRESVSELANVEIRQKGVCDQAGTACVTAYADASTSRLAETGGPLVETVTLDEDLKDTVNFIKINLEGAEAAALQGCGGHIHRSRPKLAIRLDHQNEDLWKIPRMVDRLEPKYKLYLRHYGGNLVPAEYVLFAV